MGRTKRFVLPVRLGTAVLLLASLLAIATGTFPARVEPAFATSPGCVASTGATLHQFTFSGVRYCTEEFTANGTWTRPSWVTSIDLIVVGGGGGGGCHYRGGGGGGGGGGLITGSISVSAATPTYPVVVGDGGVRCGLSGSATGGTSSFGSPLFVATGGSPGDSSSGTGGASGTGSRNSSVINSSRSGGGGIGYNTDGWDTATGNWPKIGLGGGGGGWGQIGSTASLNSWTNTGGGLTWVGYQLATPPRGGGPSFNPLSEGFGVSRQLGCGGGGGSSAAWSSLTLVRFYLVDFTDSNGCPWDPNRGGGAHHRTTSPPTGQLFSYVTTSVFTSTASDRDVSSADLQYHNSTSPRANSGGGGGGQGACCGYSFPNPGTGGSESFPSSGASGVVLVRYAAPVPVNTTPPSVSPSNTPWVGTTMTRTPGTWTTPINTLTYTGKWVRKSVTNVFTDIPGATFPTYTVTSADIDHQLLYVETASNGVLTTTATSSATVKVQGLPVFTAATPPTVADIGYFDGYTFAASGGQVTYSIHPSGALPNGLTFNATTGALAGAPTVSTSAISYQVVATNSVGSATTSALSLTVSDGVVGSMNITTQPVGGPSGANLTTQPSLTLADSIGRRIARPTAVTVSATPAGVTVSGTTTINSSVGSATYTNLALTGLVDTDYFLVFTSGAFSATSSAVRLTPGAVHSLRIDTQPVSAASAGSALATQPILTVLDAQGNVVNDRPTTVTVSAVLASSTNTVAGSVGGTQAAGLASVNGTLTFSNLTFGGLIGTNYKLKFAVGAVSVLSNNVSNSASGTAARLGVITQPAYTGAQTVGSVFTTQPVVSILDAGGNPTTSTATVSAASSGGVLGGSTSVAGVNGTVTYSALTFAGLIGTSYTLTFSSPGLVSTTSATFAIPVGSTVGAVSVVSSTISASPSTIVANGASTSAVTVQMKDLGGNNITSSQGTVTLSATSVTLSAVTDNNNGTYTATFTAPAVRGSGSVVISGLLNGVTMSATATITLLSTQTISFTQGAVTLGSFPFALTATASSTLPVSYSLGGATTNGSCTVTSAGIVTVHALGNCQIHANQAGDSTYAAAPQVSQTFVVGPARPSAPFITAVTPGNGSASLTFIAPGFNGGSAITDYEYSINGGTTWLTATTSASPLSIIGLTNGVTISALIRAVNGVGAGLASDPSAPFTPLAAGAVVVTASATTPSAPRELAAEEDTATSVIIRWKVPRSDGGSPITSYSVVVSPSVTCTASFVETTGVETCTASGLTPGQQYTFTVQAVNANGQGTAATVTYTVPGGGAGSGSGGSGGGSTGGGGGGGGGTTGGGGNKDDDKGGDNGRPGAPIPPGGPSAPPLPGTDGDGDGVPDNPWTPSSDPSNIPGKPCSGCIQLFPGLDDDGGSSGPGSGGSSPGSGGSGGGGNGLPGSGGGTSGKPGVLSSPPGSQPGVIIVSTGTGTDIVIGGNGPNGKPATGTTETGGFVVQPPGNVPIVLGGLKPGSTVTVWLADNLSVSGVVGPDGSVTLMARVPAGLAAGTYTGRIDMVEASGRPRSILFGFEWRGMRGTLPATGSNTQGVLVIVMWLMVAGVLINAISRRRLIR